MLSLDVGYTCVCCFQSDGSLWVFGWLPVFTTGGDVLSIHKFFALRVVS